MIWILIFNLHVSIVTGDMDTRKSYEQFLEFLLETVFFCPLLASYKNSGIFELRFNLGSEPCREWGWVKLEHGLV